VRAVDETTGRILWSVDVGRPVADGELGLAAKGLLVLASGGRLLRLDPTTGAELASAQLGGDKQGGMQVDGSRLLLLLHTQKQRNQPARETLQARDVEDLSVLWEYEDAGTFTGVPAVDGGMVAVAGADGVAVLFR
jgi:outer membrane protein assembly factor BamB